MGHRFGCFDREVRSVAGTAEEAKKVSDVCVCVSQRMHRSAEHPKVKDSCHQQLVLRLLSAPRDIGNGLRRVHHIVRR